VGSLSSETARTSGQVAAAGVTGAVLGAGGGLALADAVDGNLVWGAVAGAVVFGALSAWADAGRVPGRPQPAPVRIVGSVLLGAVAGWMLEVLLPDWAAWAPCLLVGAVSGFIGFRPAKVALGAAVGALVGAGFETAAPAAGWAMSVAVTILIYRSLATVIWRGEDQIRIVGEGMPQDRARFVVPLTEVTSRVGVDYLERYAKNIGAAFTRDPPDAGIVESIDSLRGPWFDPLLIHPSIREFYEHTSRFALSIVPEWKPWMRLPYRFYRRTIARPLGQANAPFEIEESQGGVISRIEVIDVDHDGVTDFRAWIRAYPNGDPLYVGIYTVQEIDGIAYVAVGFPIPSGSFTATLVPSNHRGDGLILRSDAGAPHAGHYLTFLDAEGLLSTVQLRAFGEEIEVFMLDGELKTEHRFMLGGALFLTLHYEIRRKL
jgi:hypothetical protein